MSSNTYVLGSTPEIDMVVRDTDGVVFTPHLIRLSVTDPAGDILTVSGGLQLPGETSIVTASGYLAYVYTPTMRGWHEYEVWVRDGNGVESASVNGFEIVD